MFEVELEFVPYKPHERARAGWRLLSFVLLSIIVLVLDVNQ